MPRHSFALGDRVRTRDSIQIINRRNSFPPAGTEATVIELVGQYSVRCDFGTAWQNSYGDSKIDIGWEFLEPAPVRSFYLVAIQDGKEVLLRDHPTFDTGLEAARYAVDVAAKMGCKVQPRRIAEATDWRAREQARIDTGEYEKMPAGWDLAPIKDHFLHRSKHDRSMVSFTESPEKGVIDRQTRMSPGKYLNRYYEHLMQDEIKRYIAMIDANIEVKFAVTADEIEEVYAYGPDSCMAGPYDYNDGGDFDDEDDYESCDSNYGQRDRRVLSSSCHPVRVYGDSDLQVAYLRTGIRVTARAVVWPAKKIWVRTYGDIARLERGLEALGYVHDSNLVGARIRKIVNKRDGAYVLPYLDSVQAVSDPDDGSGFLIISHDGDICADRTDGIGKRMKRCERTDEMYSPDEYEFVPVIVSMEPYQAEEWVDIELRDYATVWAGEFYAHNLCTYVEAYGYMPDHVLDSETFVSYQDDERYLNRFKVELGNGKAVTGRQARDNCRTCFGNGKLYLEIDMEQRGSVWLSKDYIESMETDEAEASAAA